ncbi:MAG: radical SAM protein [Bacteroides sp.]|nr:radical SAM protein [Eubacterium sp.]MCM1418575.1 radical SAM protein [Roseburia sp.]MCM1462630.1 radical SAM protein [Bacteroides sp.]
MRRTNLAVFIPHMGCPHRCSFCDQRVIGGRETPPSPSEVVALLTEQQPILARSGTTAQIAFFGGSFTAVERGYMTALLETAAAFIRRYPAQYDGIRCSTRPDAVDGEIAAILKAYGVTAVELGAQSMSDEVLSANRRGHTAAQTLAAARLLKESGFELGLQMMTGLYRDTPERCIATARAFIAMSADTVRIYPTVVLRGTELGSLYERGLFKSFGFDETIELCAELLTIFGRSGVPVIRLGLHASPDVERDRIGGVYHPALRELVESRACYKKIKEETDRLGGRRFTIYADRRMFSRIVGQKRENRERLAREGLTFRLKEEDGTPLRVEAAE